tara:strand:- start:1101 stop:1313 length:213 start_codon:yes stop_codon:yes gene_type:complete
VQAPQSQKEQTPVASLTSLLSSQLSAKDQESSRKETASADGDDMFSQTSFFNLINFAPNQQVVKSMGQKS